MIVHVAALSLQPLWEWPKAPTLNHVVDLSGVVSPNPKSHHYIIHGDPRPLCKTFILSFFQSSSSLCPSFLYFHSSLAFLPFLLPSIPTFHSNPSFIPSLLPILFINIYLIFGYFKEIIIYSNLFCLSGLGIEFCFNIFVLAFLILVIFI